VKSWSFCAATASAPARAVRIFKTYGSDAIQVMSENPYRLARDIRGIGFKTADAIAMKLGIIEKTAMIRVRAGISYALTEAMLQNGTSLLGRPPGIPRHQPRRSCRIFKGLHSALCGYRRKNFVEA